MTQLDLFHRIVIPTLEWLVNQKYPCNFNLYIYVVSEVFIEYAPRMNQKPKRGRKPSKKMEIVNFVRNQIACGRWSPGERIPFRTWFFNEFSTTPNTVQKAFDQLRDEGFILAVPHFGTSVVDKPPFLNRHLVLLYGSPERPGMLTQAILTAAKNIEGRRAATFDFAYVLDKPDNDPDSLAVYEAVKAHRYASVYFEAFSRHAVEIAIASTDNVPMSGVFAPVPEASGSLVYPLGSGLPDATSADVAPLFEECRKNGVRKIAVFDGSIFNPDREMEIRRQAKTYGLECGPYHIQIFSPDRWRIHLAKYALRAALAPEMPWQPEALVISDDNFVPVVEDVLKEFYGAAAAKRFFIVSHGNLPHLPPSSLPIVFHGLDIEKTMESVIDYAASCMNTSNRRPEPPRLFSF